ncbi:MAG: UDP-N-acetylmuramoyl-tripeptide--D-alanyl-D-alanine ligase [Gammaproteobacteria bacterium]|nr:MAG: UDP-N-acetylmuramoyl-tripeptide--D-alanyl-D-alanine ligase [Gammaproteobacteria bacterium]
MIPLSLAEISTAIKGLLLNDNSDIVVTQLNTDSRAISRGELFLALKGPNFDGHRFVEQVAEKGAVAVIVDHQQNIALPQIIVRDTHIALGKLAAFNKARVAPKTVGITGSSGKTTVKEMTAAILSRLGKVLATQGNFNNDIGVPLTLLRLEQQHDFAVIEMGANHIGEIAYTTHLVKPDVAVINNIAAAHLEGFGDLCGVARAKGEIFESLTDNGVALYNQDSKYANKWQWRLIDKQVRRFSCMPSSENKSDCYSCDVVLDDNGCASFKLNTYQGNTYIELTVPGRHNVCNAVAAAAIALEFGASLDDIRLGLLLMAPVKGRLNLYQLNEQCRLIDDTYNANVESVKAAIDLLATYPGRQILILGDMGELGADARRYHQEVGEYAASKNLTDVLTLGVLSQSSTDAFVTAQQQRNEMPLVNGQHFSSRSQLITHLQSKLVNEAQQISILVKGSRSAHMEYVVEAIQLAYQTTAQRSQQQDLGDQQSC